MVGLVVFGLVSIYRSALFTIERIEVTGNVRLADDEILALFELPDGATLLRYPRTEIEEQVLASPWIAEARVRGELPDALSVLVVEREPFVLVDVGESLFWLVDREGIVIEQRAPDTGDSMIVVRDLVDFVPSEGEAVDSPSLINALEVSEGLSEELRARVRAISAESVDLTTLITTDDIEILIGSSEEIDRKDVVARTILEEQADSAVYINVRTPDRPTWRGIELP